MIKLIGIVVFSFSICAYGIFLSSSLKEKGAVRHEAVILLQSIERAIRYGNMPISYAIDVCSLPNLSKCGLPRAIKCFGARENINACLSSFSDEDREMLCNFFCGLGKSSCSEYELKNCRYCLDYFENTQKEFEKDIMIKASLYKKIGLIAGLISAIIFI